MAASIRVSIEGIEDADARRAATERAREAAILEEILGRGVGQLPHPEVIDEEEGHGGELREGGLAGAGELGLREILEQDMGLAVEHAVPLLDRGEAEGLGEVAFPGVKRPGGSDPETACVPLLGSRTRRDVDSSRQLTGSPGPW
jgi:hypothetical protein